MLAKLLRFLLACLFGRVDVGGVVSEVVLSERVA